MRKLILLLLLSLPGLLASAQQTRVSGKVTNANGEPMAGASVVVNGQRRGVATNAAGEFTIEVPAGAKLIVTSIGFTSQEIAANSANLTIALNPDNTQLSDVVVVGYGTQTRAAITGSVVTIKNEALTRRQVASTSNLLQGLAPGVTVQQQSGKPGGDAASIRIRGTSSFAAGSDPLVIIDGVISTLDNIDPYAIESINVLKDAASTAIYGSRASNGVILVRTKRASGNGLKVSYNAFVSKQVATAIPERTTSLEHMELSNLAEQNRTGNPAAFLYAPALIEKYKTTAPNNMDVFDTDWLDLLLTNSGLMQNHNVQLVSGGERLNVFTSVSYLKQQGLIQNNSFEKYDVRFNPDFKINDKLTVSGVISYNNSKTINPSTSSPEFIIRQALGLPALGAAKFGEGMYGTAGQTNNRNPLASAEAAGTSVRNDNTFLTRAGFTYRPIKNLEVEAYWARETRNPTTKTFVKNVDIYQPNLVTNTYDKIAVWPGSTSLGQGYFNNVYKTYLGQATYTGTVKNHNFKVLAGAQTELFTNSYFSASRTGFINPNQPYLNLGSGARDNDASASELALSGFFSRINYNYNDRYFLELNGRYDGSSRFSQELKNQWGFFPSVSAGWIISKERFFEQAGRLITFAKLRGSVGTLGNQALSTYYPFDAFYGQSTYSNPDNGTNAYFNNITTLGYAILEFPNQQIKWEKSNQWNIGADIGIAKDLTIAADYYVRGLTDMLLRQPLPSYAGGALNPAINAGKMENRGWELSLNYRKKLRDVGFDFTAMISDVRNKITSLAGNPFFDNGSSRTQEGQPINSYFGYQALGYFQDTNQIKSAPVQFGTPFNGSNAGVGPKPGDVQYADISGPNGKPDGKIDAFDRTFIGNAFPRYEYSINLNLTYKNFDLNVFGQGVGRRDNYLTGTGAIPFNSTDFAASLLAIHKDFWTPSNPNASFPRLLPSGSGGNNYVTSSLWIRNAAYFRLKNLNLGYRLPQALISQVKISSARIFVSASNVFTITKSWKGFDPEINNQNAEFYPLMKTFTAGLNVSF